MSGQPQGPYAAELSRIQAEDWNPGGRTDAFSTGFVRCEWSAQKKIEQGHGAILLKLAGLPYVILFSPDVLRRQEMKHYLAVSNAQPKTSTPAWEAGTPLTCDRLPVT